MDSLLAEISALRGIIANAEATLDAVRDDLAGALHRLDLALARRGPNPPEEEE